MRIQTKVIIAVGLLLLITIGILYWVGYDRISTITEELNNEVMGGELAKISEEIKGTYEPLKEMGMENNEEYVRTYQEELFEKFKDYKFRETGYFTILKPDGKVVFHPTLDQNSDSGFPKVKEMVEMGEGFLAYDWHGEEKFYRFNHFEPWDWYVGITIPAPELMAHRDNYSSTIILAGLIILVAGIIVFYFIVSINVNKPIQKAVEIISNINDDILSGHLTSRGAPEMVSVDFQQIVERTNSLIDAFVTPINENARMIEKMGSGDIPDKITEERPGDFNRIKNSMNQSIDAINALVEDANKLVEAAKEGRFDVRADASRHQGDYRLIIQGVNNTMDIVHDYVTRQAQVSDYNKCEVKRLADNLNRLADGNFNLDLSVGECDDSLLQERKNFEMINQNLEAVKNSIGRLVEDVNSYVRLVNKGELDNIKFEAQQYKGMYRIIADGLNKAAAATFKPLQELMVVFEKMAQGDLTPEMKGQYEGVFARLKAAGNKSLQVFNRILSEVNRASDQMASGARQVADASQSLSQGATEQAASLEEISASLQQIGSQSRLNADNADLANNLSIESQEAAKGGNGQMENLMKAMEEINDASSSISKIIKTIDDIAFQTNILSLNAAVEAARAGRHGKGFAVVAEAVRNLAARSAKAARETSDMIEGSINKISRGTDLATATSKMLIEIVTSATKTTDIVGEIAAASKEQASGVEQVNVGLQQVEQVTQANTSSAEQSASAAEQLSAQAADLKRMMRQFVLRGLENRMRSDSPRNRRSLPQGQKPRDMQEVSPDEIIAFDDDEE